MQAIWVARARLVLLLAVLSQLENTIFAANYAVVVDGVSADASAVHPEPRTTPGNVEESLWNHDATSWSSSCSDCGGAGCAGCFPQTSARRYGLKLFGGADYLEAQPKFSDSLAFVRQVRATAPNPLGVLENLDQDVNFDFQRTDSVRAFIGLRLEECGSELRFTYWRLRSRDQVSDTAGTDANGNNVLLDIWNVNAVVAGDQLIAESRVSGNIYDIEYKRCVHAFNTCGPAGNCCLPWTLHWSAGVRMAEWNYDNSIRSTAAVPESALVSMEYDGVGPLIGLDGRRSLRMLRCGFAYASFHTALLLGQFDHSLVRTAEIGPNTSRDVFLASQDRIVPVTELEVGLEWQFGRYMNVSGGWFHQVWWDLGMSEDVIRDSINLVRDDANIMAWDGFTFRFELSF